MSTSANLQVTTHCVLMLRSTWQGQGVDGFQRSMNHSFTAITTWNGNSSEQEHHVEKQWALKPKYYWLIKVLCGSDINPRNHAYKTRSAGAFQWASRFLPFWLASVFISWCDTCCHLWSSNKQLKNTQTSKNTGISVTQGLAGNRLQKTGGTKSPAERNGKHFLRLFADRCRSRHRSCGDNYSACAELLQHVCAFVCVRWL